VSETAGHLVELSGYSEVLEAFRSPLLRTLVEPGTGSLRSGTVLRIEGGEHTRRRRTLNRLTSRDGAAWFRDRELVPIANEALGALRWSAQDRGRPAFDLVEFGNLLFLRLVFAQIGLPPIASDEEIREVRDLVAELELAYLGSGSPAERETMVRRGLAAKETFGIRYFLPALTARTAILASVERGERPEAELPRDLLTLIASHAEPEWADSELALREAVTDILFAGTANSVHSLVHAVDELLGWLESHPEDRDHCGDADFLARVVSEALRIHVVNVAFFRLATADVELSGGTRIPAGAIARLGIRAANLDASVFGPDAADFNPNRVLRQGVYPYGLAFGSGVHMCFGLNVVLGPDQVSGTHVHMLRELFGAGIQRDPQSPPRRPAAGHRDVFETYPVLLERVPSSEK
jgi:cytochrome P450